MKNFKFKLLLTCYLIALISCNKSPDLIAKDEVTISKTAITQILNISNNQQAQRSMYNLLSANEKSEIWMQKFTGFLNENNLNSKQKLFVQRIKNLMTPQFFVNNSIKEKVNEPELKATAINLFGVDVAFSLLCTLEKSPIPNTVDPGGTDCTCSKSSDWCGQYTTCLGAICTETNSGCGTFWSYSCTGRCQTGV
ncbi:bacteriocin fulvocin C-related protein [Ferruginibacter sp.]|nr:bacteriocin fulvocin C-related protein [Ferruginibacter sp.]